MSASVWAKVYSATTRNATIPSIDKWGTAVNSPSGTESFKIKVASETTTFVGTVKEGKSQSQSSGAANITTPIQTTVDIAGLTNLVAVGSANLKYPKPKIKNYVVVDPNVKVTDSVTGNLSPF